LVGGDKANNFPAPEYSTIDDAAVSDGGVVGITAPEKEEGKVRVAQWRFMAKHVNRDTTRFTPTFTVTALFAIFGVTNIVNGLIMSCRFAGAEKSDKILENPKLLIKQYLINIPTITKEERRGQQYRSRKAL